MSKQSDPIYHSGSADIGVFLANLEAFDVNVTTKPGQFERVLKAFRLEIQRAKKFGFTPTELDRTKQNYLTSMQTALQEKDKTASSTYVNEYLSHFLKAEASPGITTEFKLVQDLLPAINLADINALARKYIVPVNNDIIIPAPAKDRTIAKEKLYNCIITKIREIKPGFLIGVNTGIETREDYWFQVYRHLSFKPDKKSTLFSPSIS